MRLWGITALSQAATAAWWLFWLSSGYAPAWAVTLDLVFLAGSSAIAGFYTAAWLFDRGR